MQTVITFLVDTHSLPAPGTFERPAWTNHFPTVVSRDGGAPIHYNSEDTVRASVGDRIIIAFQDAAMGLYVELAPVMFLAHRWGADANSLKVLTPGDLADSNPDKPLDKPRFDVNHVGLPKMQYVGSETDWQQVQPNDNLSWKDGVKISENTSVSTATLYGPYVTFNFQDEPGILEYGLSFSVSKDGKTMGYYYFDPCIQVA